MPSLHKRRDRLRRPRMGEGIEVTRARVVGFLGAFAVAIWSLSTGWAALQATWAVPTPTGAFTALAYFALFVVSILFLGFWQYAADRAAGRVQRRIGVYEWVLRRKM